MSQQHIVALGGGGFSMEESPVLDDYILSLSRSPRPKVCFVATASGDNENYIVRFYRRFNRADCTPTHLELFRRTVVDLAELARTQDVIYVGGGNTANMLAIWRLHGFDDALRRAVASGTVLAGISAGSICWFEAGVTDSFAGPLSSLEGLGLLSGSNCPHYDGEAGRRPGYHRLIQDGLSPGMAADDGAALHFTDGELHRVVSSRPKARAYRVRLAGTDVVEAAIEPDYLGQ
jgi:dipeptidase E